MRAVGTAARVIAFGPEAVPTAAACLQEAGVVLVLADRDADAGFLPAATDAERARASTAPDPAGHLLRRRIARAIAAHATGHDAAGFAIASTVQGQPVLSGPGGLHVSFAAREGFSLIGLAGRTLGADLEREIAPDAIPWNILRPDEAETLRALPDTARAGGFIALWTGKEAALKALGTGLGTAPEALWITRDGIVLRHQDPSSDPEWQRLPLQVSWPERHDVFHNTFRIAVALLSNSDTDPFQPGHS